MYGGRYPGFGSGLRIPQRQHRCPWVADVRRYPDRFSRRIHHCRERWEACGGHRFAPHRHESANHGRGGREAQNLPVGCEHQCRGALLRSAVWCASKLWTSNTTLMTHTVPMPKDMACKKASSIDPKYKLPGDDCFYGYDSLDAADKGKAAYFGHKVLALSYGGTLQLLGVKGATYDTKADDDPSSTGTSWMRLTNVSADQKTITLSKSGTTWAAGDHIVVTTTDYMPTHNEEMVIDHLVGTNMVVLTAPLKYPHNATVYPLPSDTPASIGPRGPRAIDTRAAVGLLTRSIEILSEGNQPDTDTSEHDHFPPTKGNYFGGHTIVRQGFSNFQVKGVEFYRLGQGGVIGHYPVHFHMARKTPQPSDPTQMPYLRDSSIHESMTRWITVHATQGMTIARNVG